MLDITNKAGILHYDMKPNEANMCLKIAVSFVLTTPDQY